MDKNKLVLPTVILLSSIILGGFYYASQISKQKSIEKQQQVEIEQKEQEWLNEELKEQQAEEQEKQQQLDKEIEKQQAEQALNSCIAAAKEIYSKQWLKECKAQGKLSNSCIELIDMTREEYIEQNQTPIEEYLDHLEYFDDIKYFDDLETLLINRNKKLAECSCSLPVSLADRVNDSLEKNKDECFRKYPHK